MEKLMQIPIDRMLSKPFQNISEKQNLLEQLIEIHCRFLTDMTFEIMIEQNLEKYVLSFENLVVLNYP